MCVLVFLSPKLHDSSTYPAGKKVCLFYYYLVFSALKLQAFADRANGKKRQPLMSVGFNPMQSIIVSHLEALKFHDTSHHFRSLKKSFSIVLFLSNVVVH